MQGFEEAVVKGLSVLLLAVVVYSLLIAGVVWAVFTGSDDL